MPSPSGEEGAVTFAKAMSRLGSADLYAATHTSVFNQSKSCCQRSGEIRALLNVLCSKLVEKFEGWADYVAKRLGCPILPVMDEQDSTSQRRKERGLWREIG